MDIGGIGDFLLVSGSDNALELVRDAAIRFLVDDIHAYKTRLLDNGTVKR